MKKNLTPFQIRIGELLAQGLKAKEIAAITGVKVDTVEIHKFNAFERTGAKNAVQFVYQLLKEGLIK